MSNSENNRILIVVFDALRPEFVTSELMPNLSNFARNGVRYTNSHSTFPTETRVNQSAVITGCPPQRHGIVANKFMDEAVSPGKIFNTGDEDALSAAFERTDGRLLHMPTLSQRLASIGKSYATLSTGTPGGARLINHDAESTGNFRLSLHRPDATCPAGVMQHIENAIGPIPKYELPAVNWVTYAVDCYLEYIEKQIKPNVMLLWLSEPDESFHYMGIGSDESLTAIRHADTEFGRLLAVQEQQITSGALQIITLSDHGQISLSGQPINLEEKFKEGGFAISTAADRDAQAIAIIDNGGGLWLTQPDEKLLEQLINWLQHQDWCGPLFTATGIGGTLKHDDASIGHTRAPDIALALRYNDDLNTWGRKGQTLHDASYPVGGGCHGGLSQYELHNFLAMSGSCFGNSRIIDMPAGNLDITPTVLSLLGHDISSEVDGRILAESMENPKNNSNNEPVEHSYSSSNKTGAISHLSVTQVGSTRYLNRAWSL